jgi:hypothetical protein
MKTRGKLVHWQMGPMYNMGIKCLDNFSVFDHNFFAPEELAKNFFLHCR